MPVWDGNWLWIWQTNAIGDKNYIKDMAKDMGLTGVLVKAHDGSLSSPVSKKYMQQFKEIIGPLKEAGLGVAAWGYLYGNNPPGEVEAAGEAIKAGADWYVMDVEVEFEPGRRTARENEERAKQFCEGLNKEYPHIPKGFTSFAIPEYHPLPYHVFALYVDVMMPQIYWYAIGWNLQFTFEKSFGQWKKFGLPVAPVGQSYGGSPGEEMVKFADLALEKGCTGISWWDWQHAAGDQLRTIGAISGKFRTAGTGDGSLS